MLSVLASSLVFVFFAIYFVSIFRKNTVPVIISWIVWAVNDSALAISIYYEKGPDGFMIGTAVGSILTMFLSFKFGKIEWSKTDITCGIIAFGGIWLAYTHKDPRITILSGCIVAVLSSIPTIRSIKIKPEEENRLAWLAYYSATWCAIVAIGEWSPSVAVPVTFMVIGTYCQYLLWRPRKEVKTE